MHILIWFLCIHYSFPLLLKFRGSMIKLWEKKEFQSISWGERKEKWKGRGFLLQLFICSVGFSRLHNIQLYYSVTNQLTFIPSFLIHTLTIIRHRFLFIPISFLPGSSALYLLSKLLFNSFLPFHLLCFAHSQLICYVWIGFLSLYTTTFSNLFVCNRI